MQDHKEQARSVSMTDGEVKKVDLDSGKVTLKHSEIKHLGMPPMTMAFAARNKNLLSNLKPGDQVKFMVISENGRMILTDIRLAK